MLETENKVNTSIKNLSLKLYMRIGKIAEHEKRSINAELLVLLEKAVKMVEEGHQDAD